MSGEIIIVLAILFAVMIVLVTEWVALEVVALLVLGVLALTGIVSPIEALSGFSNPAVVTIWAVFILGGGLTRTGIANIIGRHLLKVAKLKEPYLAAIIMVLAGSLSAFMNNTAVAALLLPVIMDIARKTNRSPSTLLMPLAYGSLLGGLTTMIGTPPNIIATEALRDNGLTPFDLFDFTPLGLIVMFSGTAFVSFIGIKLLPKKAGGSNSSSGDNDSLAHYELTNNLFQIIIPSTSPLVNKTLTKSRLGSGFGFNVVSIIRGNISILAPEMSEVIRENDKLIIGGQPDRDRAIDYWGQLELESNSPDTEDFYWGGMQVAEVQLSSRSEFIDQRLSSLNIRNKFGLNILAIKRNQTLIVEDLKVQSVKVNDILLVQGPAERVMELHSDLNFLKPVVLIPDTLKVKYLLDEYAQVLRVPLTSKLIGLRLDESRLGEAVDVQIICIRRKDGSALIPTPEYCFEPEDSLVVLGAEDMISILLMNDPEMLYVEDQSTAMSGSMIEDDHVGLIEVMLSPNSSLPGLTLKQLNFRDKYGLTVLAIRRRGQVHRSDLGDIALEFGDVVLLYGKRTRHHILGQEPDFLVLSETAQELPREEKAKMALAIMAIVLFPVIMGWVPIYIAVVIGSALMVLSKCLTMEEAYRYIEWKAVFLIAGMMPLGIALDRSGAAGLIAVKVLEIAGPFGPHAVLLGLLVITFLATSIIPTAALVVLIVPITLKTSVTLGISPHALIMGIALAASSSFMSPISHPANVLVMGPGGYRFKDYLKVGIPLTLVVLIVLMIFLPMFWSLTP